MDSICNQLRCRFATWRVVLAGGFLAFGTHLIAQEALEESFEVDRSRRARKEAIDRNLYNLKAGPVLLRFDALMGFEINDNPHLLDDPEEVDFAFRPQLDTAALWALNARNALSFNLGLGYVKYIHNTDLDHLIIAPNSEIAIDIYTGDFVINVHERVSHSQDPASDPTVSGTGDFGGIENTVGVRADWNLNKLTVSAGYDHFNFISTGSGIAKALARGTNPPPVDRGRCAGSFLRTVLRARGSAAFAWGDSGPRSERRIDRLRERLFSRQFAVQRRAISGSANHARRERTCRRRISPLGV